MLSNKKQKFCTVIGFKNLECLLILYANMFP